MKKKSVSTKKRSSGRSGSGFIGGGVFSHILSVVVYRYLSSYIEKSFGSLLGGVGRVGVPLLIYFLAKKIGNKYGLGSLSTVALTFVGVELADMVMPEKTVVSPVKPNRGFELVRRSPSATVRPNSGFTERNITAYSQVV